MKCSTTTEKREWYYIQMDALKSHDAEKVNYGCSVYLHVSYSEYIFAIPFSKTSMITNNLAQFQTFRSFIMRPNVRPMHVVLSCYICNLHQPPHSKHFSKKHQWHDILIDKNDCQNNVMFFNYARNYIYQCSTKQWHLNDIMIFMHRFDA